MLTWEDGGAADARRSAAVLQIADAIAASGVAGLESRPSAESLQAIRRRQLTAELVAAHVSSYSRGIFYVFCMLQGVGVSAATTLLRGAGCMLCLPALGASRASHARSKVRGLLSFLFFQMGRRDWKTTRKRCPSSGGATSNRTAPHAEDRGVISSGGRLALPFYL